MTAALAERVPERDGLDALAERLHEVRAQRAAGSSTGGRCASSTRCASRCPTTPIVVADMCIPGYWLAGFYTPAAPRRLQIPLGWGTLGYAFPAALGAALAGAGPVVAVAGDGGFLFACGELATMAQEKIPLTAVVVDDGGYGMLRYDQDVAGASATASICRRPTSRRWRRAFGIRAADRRRARRRRSARRSPRTSPTPSRRVLVARTPDPLVPPPNTSPNWYRRRALMEPAEQALAFGVGARTTCTSGCPPGSRAGGGRGDRPAGLPARPRGRRRSRPRVADADIDSW